jgi:aryl-alcohol dehydrogenase-like predicted oxidoreductase
MKTAGKIGAYGIAAKSVTDVESFLKWDGVSIVQTRFWRGDRELLTDIIRLSDNHQVRLIAREVFAGSAPDNALTRGEVLREPLKCPSVDVVLVGTSSVEHLHENVAAL